MRLGLGVHKLLVARSIEILKCEFLIVRITEVGLVVDEIEWVHLTLVGLL